MQIRCPYCSQIIETPSVAPGQQVCCPVCNNCFYPPQQQQPQQCHYCGGQNDPGAANCQYCGYLLQTNTQADCTLAVKPSGNRILLIIVCIVVGILLLLTVAALILLPALDAQQVRCTNNLKQAGLGVFMYANDNRDYLPTDFPAIENYVHPLCMTCVTTGRTYTYLGSGLNFLKIPEPHKFPVIIDFGNHNKTVIVCYADGSVRIQKLPYKMTTATEVINEIYPDAKYSTAGRILLQNAKESE